MRLKFLLLIFFNINKKMMEFKKDINDDIKCINCNDSKVYHPINGCNNYKETSPSIFSWGYNILKSGCEKTRSFVNDNKYLLISPLLVYTMIKSPVQTEKYVVPIALFVSLYANLHLLSKDNNNCEIPKCESIKKDHKTKYDIFNNKNN